MNKKRIALDLDGVLVDFVAGACMWHELDVPREDVWPPGCYDLETLVGMRKDEFWDGMTREFWATLPWIPEGQEILEMCCKAVGASNIVIATTPTFNPECAAGKMDWIYKNLPASFKRRFLIGPPKHFLAHPNMILVDDADKNYGEFLAHQGCAVLVPRIWNSNHANRHRVVDYVREQLEKELST
jgi:5'(3')-deoxyribonucleotidase